MRVVHLNGLDVCLFCVVEHQNTVLGTKDFDLTLVEQVVIFDFGDRAGGHLLGQPGVDRRNFFLGNAFQHRLENDVVQNQTDDRTNGEDRDQTLFFGDIGALVCLFGLLFALFFRIILEGGENIGDGVHRIFVLALNPEAAIILLQLPFLLRQFGFDGRGSFCCFGFVFRFSGHCK